MPRLSIQIPHNLGREEATRRIQEQLPKFRDKVSDLEEQWVDHSLNFRFKAVGFPVTGTLAVEESTANVDVDLPLAAVMIKGMIEQGIRNEFGAMLT